MCFRNVRYFLNKKLRTVSLFLHKYICCEYSLEASERGALNEYQHHMFFGEIRKINSPDIPYYLDHNKLTNTNIHVTSKSLVLMFC